MEVKGPKVSKKQRQQEQKLLDEQSTLRRQQAKSESRLLESQSVLAEQQSEAEAAQRRLAEQQESEIRNQAVIAGRERADEIRKDVQSSTDWLVRLFGARNAMKGGNLRAPIYGA